MVFAPFTFVYKLRFWPNITPSQLIFLRRSTHFIGRFSILYVFAKHSYITYKPQHPLYAFKCITPKNYLHPIMISIARTTGLTETSGTRICPFYDRLRSVYSPASKVYSIHLLSLTSWVRSSFRSLANIYCCCDLAIDWINSWYW